MLYFRANRLPRSKLYCLSVLHLIVSDVVFLKILLCSGISGLESTDQGCPNTRPCVGPDGRGCYKPVSRTLSSVESYLSKYFGANQIIFRKGFGLWSIVWWYNLMFQTSRGCPRFRPGRPAGRRVPLDRVPVAHSCTRFPCYLGMEI